MKFATIPFPLSLRLLVAFTLAAGSLTVFTQPSAAQIPASALADGPDFPNCQQTSTTTTPCDLQVFLLIDDSSSMLYSDPSRQRLEGVRNVLDILAKEYYLPVVDAQDPNIALPDIQVSLIHFTSTVINQPAWKTIHPGSINDWPDQLKAFDADIMVPPTTGQKLTTDFRRAFEAAARLAVESPQTADCPRLVMLFTDGVPNLTGLDLKGKALDQYMQELQRIIQPTFQRENDLLYITAFGSNPTLIKSWNEGYEKQWQSITQDAPSLDPRRVLLVPASELAVRMERIVGLAIGNPVYTLAPDAGTTQQYTTEIPRLVESLRLTYYAIQTKTSFTVTGPDGSVFQATDRTTPIQVMEIDQPVPGTYKISTTSAGGYFTQMLRFQQITPKLTAPAENLQQFTNARVSFQLVGADDQPLEILPEMAIQAGVTQDGNFRDLTLTRESNAFSTDWMPLVAQTARIDACVTIVYSKTKHVVLYNGPVGKIAIDPVIVQAGQSAAVCALDNQEVRVPLTLINARSMRPATMNTDVKVEWPTYVKVPLGGTQINSLAIDTVDASSGAYVLRFRPNTAGPVQFHVTASAVVSGKYKTNFYDGLVSSSGYQAPRKLGLTIGEYTTFADKLSVTLYRWFHPICADKDMVILVGRRAFGLFGPTQVQVSGRFTDIGSQQEETGIERFTVQLLSPSGGKSSTAVNTWQASSAAGKPSTVEIRSPGLGFYTLAVSDQGKNPSCSVLTALPPTQTVLLINDYWEYLIVLVISILMLGLAFYLLRRNRDRPNIAFAILPVILLIVDVVLVNAMVTQAFKCQFNCASMIDKSIFGKYPASNELSFCRGAAVPSEPFDVVPSFTLGPVIFPRITIGPVNIFGFQVGPVVIPGFTIGPFNNPSLTIGANAIPLFPALGVIDPPLEIARRFVSWVIVAAFAAASLVLGSVAVRIKDFLNLLKERQGRITVLTNFSIWLLFFVIFCGVFYLRVVR